MPTQEKDKMRKENVLDPLFININAKIPTKLLMPEFQTCIN